MDPTYRLSPRIEPELTAHGSGRPAAVPRDAASLILLRDGAAGPEMYLQRRHRGMAFAGGMAVFPGGSVDPSDVDADVDWIGPSPADWAKRLSTTEPAARALVVAAVRELFEETGVLLAGSADSMVEVGDEDAWEEDRRSLEAHEVSFAEILSRRGVALRSDRLRPWAKWITPEFQPRRYATWFFAAEIPAGQEALGVSTEAQSVLWSTARDAIVAADAGQLLMMSPQYCISLELYEHSSVAQVLEAVRDLTPVNPLVGNDAEGSFLMLPGHLVALGIELGKHMYPTAVDGAEES
jgi:8-oxo-dGTP pyrophosphatase MutT (NUDIX family)